MIISDIFGELVFNDHVMKNTLPKDTYLSLQNTIKKGTPLSADTAQIVANAMKLWAMEKGATHYTHWFQPMTGITAEKHESFLTGIDKDGMPILEFCGKELVQGEADASSFPSGGIRDTFEARGYTTWDPTSAAFIKDNVLCIPTAYYSYHGEALDKKTPLLRSMTALNKQALRVLAHFPDSENITHVYPTVGAEQEFFLVDKALFQQRPDLMSTGRTLLGASSPKSQELDDHYYGVLNAKVSQFYEALDNKLWQFGILAKTKHNEVAPAQHELACIYTTANISADQNQLVMEMMKSTARQFGLECLLHEKPFAGVNGSGKHNNWSLATDTDENLFSPGKTPHTNLRFLLFVCALIKAVDTYGHLLRVSIATASNEYRLGANEAPPAIVSLYLGDELTEILTTLAAKEDYETKETITIELGVDSLPRIPKDTTDRNRTSPFAFTGNKFEFRMLGSSSSISGTNIVLNTMMADVLSEFADYIDDAQKKGKSSSWAIAHLIRKTMRQHNRIIFNGNNYDKSWEIEAQIRGLPILRTAIDALPTFISEESLALFDRHHVFTTDEIHARYEILLEDYIKRNKIESTTLVTMIEKNIIPTIVAYQTQLANLLTLKSSAGMVMNKYSTALEHTMLSDLSILSEQMLNRLQLLQADIENIPTGDTLSVATHYNNHIKPAMLALRHIIDDIETITPNWPFPSYAELLHSVH